MWSMYPRVPCFMSVSIRARCPHLMRHLHREKFCTRESKAATAYNTKRCTCLRSRLRTMALEVSNHDQQVYQAQPFFASSWIVIAVYT